MSTSAAVIATECVRLAAAPADKTQAIREAAQLLVAAGCVDATYADSMLKREAVANTFLGHGVAIPHGMVAERHLVRANGIAVLQVPGGVEWNPGQQAQLVVAIAAQSDTHLDILRRLTRLMQDEPMLARLMSTRDASEIVAALSQDAAPMPASSPAGDLAELFAWTVAYPAGLHARPASRWVEAARQGAARVQVRHGKETADARNLLALLQLGLRAGDTITVSAEGRDAVETLTRLRSLMDSLVAQERVEATRSAVSSIPATGWQAPVTGAAAAPSLQGIGASPGLAIGRVHQLQTRPQTIADIPVALADGAERLHQALLATRLQLKALADDTQRRLGASDAQIFQAQAGLLDDTDLITLSCQLMVEGHGVAWSWNEAVQRMAGKLAALGNPVLAARAADLRDVGRRVLSHIDPALRHDATAELPQDCVLIAADLSPSDTATLDAGRVAGLATVHGGPTSHTAILARTLGLPALVAGGEALLDLPQGTRVIIDGVGGRLHIDPDAATLAAAQDSIDKQRKEREQQQRLRAEPARLLDGHRIEVGANINLPDQAALALAQGAEGVGLMRTEFLFLESGRTPDEDEQYATYVAMSRALAGRPLTVRALDIGGDKQVAHLQLPSEDNPFLGVRGARLLLRRPDLLEPQLRALYRAALDGAELSIMFPMITSVAEVLALREICERVRFALHAPTVPLGIMIEVPAAALQAHALARHVDFFSVGTNDLTQYTLAIDRQNPTLAAEADSLHPAVLRLIRETVAGARAHGRWVGVCGGLAGEPFGAALLAGLGVQELSMTPRDIPAVKARLRMSQLAELQSLAAQALSCASAAEVRALDVPPPAAIRTATAAEIIEAVLP